MMDSKSYIGTLTSLNYIRRNSRLLIKNVRSTPLGLVIDTFWREALHVKVDAKS